jgi:transcriptional regulator with XRE-family HTH domain
MAASRPNESFGVVVERLLDEHDMTMRALAHEIGIDQGYISRAARTVDYKSPSVNLMLQVAAYFDIPPESFPEYRLRFVVERVQGDPALRDRLFESLSD